MLNQSTINQTIQLQREFFHTGKTKNIEFRIEQLHQLYQTIKSNEERIFSAIKADLHKPMVECFIAETGFCLSEIKNAIKNIKAWTKSQNIIPPLTQFLSSAQIQVEPLGVVLIISPWNYPFQLAIAPLIGAIAAGNCTIIKPSELTPHTSQVLADLIHETFAPAYITVVQGGIATSQQLLTEKFDHIFFTGSTAIGKIVMQAAAQHLTPVTLELGGKSPCIVDRDIPLEITARRIVWGKFFNAGQSCIAPDYLLVHRQVKTDLIASLQKIILEFYGEDPEHSADYGRIINEKQFDRIVKFLQNGQVIFGGKTNRSELYIAPTAIAGISWETPIMQEEIFGPILPIMEYENITDAIAQINQQPKPLALYIFSQNPQIQAQVLQETRSGGVCINDTLSHFVVSDLPFGGIGTSGMGQYHGKASFDTFSHQRSILNKSFLVDLKVRYAPYKNQLKLLKFLIG